MSNILKFFVKRVVVFYAIALIIFMVVRGPKLAMIVALTAGILLSLLRVTVLEALFKHLLGFSGKKHVIVINLGIYFINLVIIGVAVVIAMQFGVHALMAALLGILSVMIIVMINAVTEAFGITKNHYGQKVK